MLLEKTEFKVAQTRVYLSTTLTHTERRTPYVGHDEDHLKFNSHFFFAWRKCIHMDSTSPRPYSRE